MNKKNLTAVEWLEEALAENLKQIIVKSDAALMESLFIKAKAMEKEQMFEYIKSMYVNGEESLKFHKEDFDDYYNETYGGENE